MNATGTLYGVGVGPGDPELLTLKAVRILQSVPVVAYPATPQGGAQARDIAAAWLTGQREIPIVMPCMLDRGPVNQGYDEAAVAIADELAAGRDVAVLCEGDPLFYGSFSYLLQRLGSHKPVSSGNLSIYHSLKEEFTDVSACVDKIDAYFATELGATLSDEERLYLILHVNRICTNESS